ncbi:MAG: bifunctional precorrin-2 dehydrogenase/sirohydrochlorin ferrochelatase [Candidatus Binataceae bacterium]
MGYLPIFLDMQGRDCLVAGGGAIAEARVRALLDAGALVTVVSPELTPALQAMARGEEIHHCARNYASNDMQGRFLACIVTSDEALARSAAADAERFGVLINAADMPAFCDFITPAVVKRGAVQIAIGTGGASPALARRLRESIETLVGPEYEPFADLLRVARQWLRSRVESPDERARILSALVASELIGALKRRDREQADVIVRYHLGAGLEAIGFAFNPDSPSTSEALSAD